MRVEVKVLDGRMFSRTIFREARYDHPGILHSGREWLYNQCLRDRRFQSHICPMPRKIKRQDIDHGATAEASCHGTG